MNFERTNTKISLLEDYYSHFKEDDRLKTRHGQVEYLTNMRYLKEFIKKTDKIIDIGAGTGAYSASLFNDGFDVTAVELVKYNYDLIKKNYPDIPSYNLDARDLSIFKDNSFDVVILFGPIYHLLKEEDKILAFKEAKRICKNKGLIFVSYYMNDYAFITYGIIKNQLRTSLNEGRLDDNYHIINKDDDLFSMVNIIDINHYNKLLGLERIKIIASDGASDYIRTPLNKLSEEDFKIYLDYHLKNCERPDLLGASSHLLDIVKVNK